MRTFRQFGGSPILGPSHTPLLPSASFCSESDTTWVLKYPSFVHTCSYFGVYQGILTLYVCCRGCTWIFVALFWERFKKYSIATAIIIFLKCCQNRGSLRQPPSLGKNGSSSHSGESSFQKNSHSHRGTSAPPCTRVCLAQGAGRLLM